MSQEQENWEDITFTTGQVAKALGISRVTFVRWLEKNVPEEHIKWDGRGRRLPLPLVRKILGGKLPSELKEDANGQRGKR